MIKIIFIGVLLSAHPVMAYSSTHEEVCPTPSPNPPTSPHRVPCHWGNPNCEDTLSEELNTESAEFFNGQCLCPLEAQYRCKLDGKKCVARSTYNPDTGHGVCGYDCE